MVGLLGTVSGMVKAFNVIEALKVPPVPKRWRVTFRKHLITTASGYDRRYPCHVLLLLL